MYNHWTSTEFMALISVTLLKRHDVELLTSVIFQRNIVTRTYGGGLRMMFLGLYVKKQAYCVPSSL